MLKTTTKLSRVKLLPKSHLIAKVSKRMQLLGQVTSWQKILLTLQTLLILVYAQVKTPHGKNFMILLPTQHTKMVTDRQETI